MVPVAKAENENLTKFGDIAQLGVPIGAGVIALWKGDMEGFYQVVEGAQYTALATHALKWTIDADRPDDSANNSFPSGHTSAAVQGAAFLQFRYGVEYGLPAYAISSVVGYSRVQADKHYWRDVIAGAALATLVQHGVSNLGYSMLAFSPYATTDEVGIYASVRF